MILPIVAYGNEILRQPCAAVEADSPALQSLIDNMWQTMYVASGCGLAAPQVDRALRLFIVDSAQTFEKMDVRDRKKYFDTHEGIRETFINARITDRSSASWTDAEGCLSIPSVDGPVERSWAVTIEYLNRQFQPQTKHFTGSTARMIQHEYDHTEGILYLDYLKPLKRTLMKGKLQQIKAGKVKPKYPMRYA
ncbi:peptide deformylase [Paraflavitalea sp. CAU 1676]|uniref:peptide deformylase n=1 Tax=Paraflavitalea sp. CAU 1676 TaxID=3032598 RepID=UPI0023D9D53F|nr:peptide deformylase [Paraflavitalea sp. CAU 1676]MDF2188898.1 peptide deformylase [Paraflavitalea sp. CAU 1676]